jgi:hypothetical protein
MLTVSTASADTVTVAKSTGDENASPAVAKAIASLKDGDTLKFEKGEYHFHVEGTTRKYIVSCGGKSGEKNMVFSFEGLNNITVDGGDSTFVWHGPVYPFAFRNCRGLNVGNFTTTMYRPTVVELTVTEKSDDGFLCKFLDPKCYKIEDGHIVFDLDIGRFSTADDKISVHALDRCCIEYLFAGDTKASKVHLPAGHMVTDAEDRGDGMVFFRYRPNDGTNLHFNVGESIAFLLENNRFRSNFFFDSCSDVRFHDVTVRRGGGMGVVAQFCDGVTLERYNVVPNPGEKVSLTADCMFIVNCRGKVTIKDCEISWSMDDAMNCHGNYTKIAKAEGRKATVVNILERAYPGFFPYHPGDTVEFAEESSRKVLGTAKIASVGKYGVDSKSVELTFESDVPELPEGTLVENLTWIPDVTISGCDFHDFMHLRLSGRGKYVIENNRFTRGIGICIMDLAGYWGEAGRVADMKIRGNQFDNLNRAGNAFIFSGVTGENPGGPATPNVHSGLEITGNTYRELNQRNFVQLDGAIDPVVKDNRLAE